VPERTHSVLHAVRRALVAERALPRPHARQAARGRRDSTRATAVREPPAARRARACHGVARAFAERAAPDPSPSPRRGSWPPGPPCALPSPLPESPPRTPARAHARPEAAALPPAAPAAPAAEEDDSDPLARVLDFPDTPRGRTALAAAGFDVDVKAGGNLRLIANWDILARYPGVRACFLPDARCDGVLTAAKAGSTIRARVAGCRRKPAPARARARAVGHTARARTASEVRYRAAPNV
jgi:hypothetical protein